MSAQIVKQAGSTEYIAFVDDCGDMWIIDQEMITYISIESPDKGTFTFKRDGQVSDDIKWIKYHLGTVCYYTACELMLWHLKDEG